MGAVDSLQATTVTAPVSTMQVAPTILDLLGLNPKALQAVQMEGTTDLPGIDARVLVRTDVLDLNGDGMFDIKDITLALKRLVGL